MLNTYNQYTTNNTLVPIPQVPHELVKASQFKFFIDLDMTNSFHQIPLAESASQLLSVRTPWGLVRPRFLPEGTSGSSLRRQQMYNMEEWRGRIRRGGTLTHQKVMPP